MPTQSPSKKKSPSVAQPTDGRRRLWLAVAVLIAAPLVVFARAINAELVAWDDLWHLTENPYLNPLSWGQLRRLWIEPYFGEYVPMLYTWFAGGMVVSHWLSGSSEAYFNPTVFHAGSVLLHVACGLLVFRLLRRLIGHDVAACCGALVFVLHPLATEVVAWVSESRGLLTALFGLLAIWHYLEAFQSDSSGLPARPARSRAWRGAHYALATLCFALALVSKPSAVALPLIVAVLDWGFLRRSWRSMTLSLGLWFVMAALLTYVTKQEQSNETIREVVPLWQRPLVAADALAFYLYKLFVPLGLTLDYGRMPSVAFARGWPYWTWIVPLAAVVGLWRLGSRTVWTAAGVFVAGLFPVLGLVPFAFQDISTVADRYVYLSLLGPAILFAWVVARWPRAPVYGALALLFLAWSAIDWRQVGYWHDSQTLFTYALSKNPRSLPMYNNMVATHRNAQRYDEALRWARQALEARPERGQPYQNLGTVLQDLNRVDEAVDVLTQGVKIDPDSAPLRRGLAQALLRQGRSDEARAQYQAMLRIEPTSGVARLGLAKIALEANDRAAAERIYAELSAHPPEEIELRTVLGDLAVQLKRHDEARRYYEAAMSSAPAGEVWFKIGLLEHDRKALPAARDAFLQALAHGYTGPEVHRQLGAIYQAAGQLPQAVEHYQASLQASPDDRMVLNNLAWLLATDASGTVANGAEAVRLAEHLCEVDQPVSANSLDTLAAAYARAGRLGDAVRTAQQAIELAQTAGDAALAEEIRGHLKRFESGAPLP